MKCNVLFSAISIVAKECIDGKDVVAAPFLIATRSGCSRGEEPSGPLSLLRGFRPLEASLGAFFIKNNAILELYKIFAKCIVYSALNVTLTTQEAIRSRSRTDDCFTSINNGSNQYVGSQKPNMTTQIMKWEKAFFQNGIIHAPRTTVA
jgi:hypothetical protein